MNLKMVFNKILNVGSNMTPDVVIVTTNGGLQYDHEFGQNLDSYLDCWAQGPRFTLKPIDGILKK